MFGKKKQPPPPLVLQVLTTEYLIEGTLEDDPPLYSFAEPEYSIQIPLTSAQIQPTGPGDIPLRTSIQYVVSSYDVVALIWQSEITQISGYKGMEPIAIRRKMSKNVLSGVFYVGPYVMEGKRMSMMANVPEHPMLLADVHIASRVPEARWGGLLAPCALVNTRWLEGQELK